MPIGKHVIEHYKNYTLYVTSGVTPVLFIAEKADPAKGCTLTADSLEDLKKNVDNTLEYAIKVHINIHEKPSGIDVLPGLNVHINANGINYNSIAIVVNTKCDFDAIIEFINNRPNRRFKRSKKLKTGFNVINLIRRNCTVYQKS